MQPLPIDPALPSIVASLGDAPRLVLDAPPGAGKTTRVPRALLEAPWLAGEVVVLEPRRIAARLAARRVADELGEPVGKRVGYSVRFESAVSAETRVRFVTEGVFTRMLLARPWLHGVGAVVLDEFHERHLQTDVAFALVSHLQRNARPDLRVVVMSATLEVERVAAFLGAPVVRSEGRPFEVEVEHAPKPDERPLASQIASALRELVRRGLDGHVLVFLPGAAEIRKAHEACRPLAEAQGLDLCALHGDLPAAEQDRVLAPGPRRKIILSTNLAESSITVDGVAAVIDSGLARVATHSPWTGFSALRTAPISRASADQRAGRAGRTRRGVCLRLYTAGDYQRRPAFDPPELVRLDLSEPLLELSALGPDPASLDWLDPPPQAALEAARALLTRLGAIDARGKATPLGQRMLRFPLHPRLGRLLCEAEALGVADEGCLAAAVLGEREIRRRERVSFGGGGGARGRAGERGRSDVLARLDDLHDLEGVEGGQLASAGFDPGAVGALRRAAAQLKRLVDRRRAPRPASPEAADEALLRALLAAFPDRVGRRRKPGGREVVLAGGGAAVLAEESVVHDAPFVIVADVAEAGERKGSAPVARLASAVEADWLLELFPEMVRDERELTWNAERERVEEVERLVYDGLVLDETAARPASGEAAAARLAKAALARGLASLVEPPEAFDRWLDRARFVASLDPAFADLGDEGLARLVAGLCERRASFRELREASLLDELTAALGPGARARLDEWAPERLTLPNGRRAPIHYPAGRSPYVESRLQDFFGLKAAPSLAGGRVPLVVHLLAPNQRAVQVTQDLESFWANLYPQVRRELGRRYPRHPWPEDPSRPLPPEPRRPPRP
ncbi:MAG TPA: ATP-dependent helicase HrpB [Polyangiaceae bacterium]|nr:ATP-dependent helicase HrpB [Polyangiaceae bacterium]